MLYFILISGNILYIVTNHFYAINLKGGFFMSKSIAAITLAIAKKREDERLEAKKMNS